MGLGGLVQGLLDLGLIAWKIWLDGLTDTPLTIPIYLESAYSSIYYYRGSCCRFYPAEGGEIHRYVEGVEAKGSKGSQSAVRILTSLSLVCITRRQCLIMFFSILIQNWTSLPNFLTVERKIKSTGDPDDAKPFNIGQENCNMVQS